MARPCTVCQHPNRDRIDEAIATGESFRGIARRFCVSEDSVQRHARAHLPATLLEGTRAAEVARGDRLLHQVTVLRDRALGILDRAERTQDLRTALGAIREARGCVELLAKIAGEISEAPQVNLRLAHEWLELRQTILQALAPYPAARAALVEVLNRAR